MFGNDWERGTALVIDARYFESTGNDVAGKPSTTDLVLEVTPSHGDKFRTQITLHHMGLTFREANMVPPQIGETIPVEYVPGKDKVRVIIDDAHNLKLQKKARKNRLADAANAPVGSGTANPLAGMNVNVNDLTGSSDNSTNIVNAPAGLDIAAILAQAGLDPANAGTVTVNNIESMNVQSEQPRVVTSADILARGTAGTAQLVASELVDQSSGTPETTVLGLTLSVTLTGGQPYPVANMYRVPKDKVASLSLGAVLPIKAAPENPGLVAIDWEAIT